jgi:hypothetical protein
MKVGTYEDKTNKPQVFGVVRREKGHKYHARDGGLSNSRQDKTTQHNTTQHNTSEDNTTQTQHNTTQRNAKKHKTTQEDNRKKGGVKNRTERKGVEIEKKDQKKAKRHGGGGLDQ